MRDPDEDVCYEIMRQKRLDSENWDDGTPIQWHQKVGTVIPFSRTVDCDPNPRIPLSVPERIPAISKTEAAIWVVLFALWLAYLAFGPGEW